MLKDFNKIQKVKGGLNLPGDKSISHRAVMFSSMAKGESVIKNLSNGEDVKSTKKCFSQLGVKISEENGIVKINGKGYKNFAKPSAPLDAGNSGTTTRLISGILAAQNFETIIIGDESLSVRPMKRIIDPLKLMGAQIEASEKFTLPIRIFPVEKINAINYALPIASAQVKSAVLLAGLFSDEITSVIEEFPSRNHTEKMLGLKTEIKNGMLISYSSKKNYPEAKEYFVPSDISTASFFIVLTLIAKNSELLLKNISLNETRTGIIDVLKKMNGNIEIINQQEMAGEKYGDILVRSSLLKNIEINKEIIPNIIDEIPILSAAGIFAGGEFRITNAEELRGKETDRIKALCYNYKLLGLDVEENLDGFSISGNITNKYPVFESFGDHRIAMTFSILSLLLNEGGKVNNFDCVNISNPDFTNQLKIIAG